MEGNSNFVDMDTVVVTGFGPFGNFKINPSWEAVKELQQLGLGDIKANLIIHELPVTYDVVVDTVPKLWSDHQPVLVVHVGVSSQASALTLEAVAHKNGYKRPDVEKQQPANGMCPIGERPMIESGLDLVGVCSQMACSSNDVTCVLSCDAGRFLCEYTFYCSLSINPERSAFVHVPDTDKPYTITQMAAGLKEIIGLLLDEIRAKKSHRNPFVFDGTNLKNVTSVQ